MCVGEAGHELIHMEGSKNDGGGGVGFAREVVKKVRSGRRVYRIWRSSR
jgi:hypothetical protein